MEERLDVRLAAHLHLTKPTEKPWAHLRPGQCPAGPSHLCPAAPDLSPTQTTVIPAEYHMLLRQEPCIWAMPSFKDKRE